MATSTKTVRVELTGDPSSLERSLTVVSEKSAQTASKMEGHASRIGGAFHGLDNLLGQFGIPFTGAIGTIGTKFDELSIHGESAFKKISAAGGATLLGLTAVAVGIGIESVHLADSFEESHARLENAVKNTGGTFDQYADKIGAVDKKLENLGFTNTETESGLARLTRAAGNTDKAIRLMGLAADIARGQHKSLEFGVDILSKVLTGHVALLGRYGIATKDAAGNTLSVEQAVDALQKKFGGQASQSAETFQGKTKVLEAQLTDLGIKVGQFLIPIIEKLVTAITDVINWFEKHKAVAIALAGVITTVLGAAISVFVYDKVAAFVTGIQRMLTGLGLLEAKSAETAAAVEASGATMAESSAAGGAAVGGGAAAEGAAAGEGTAAAGAAGSLMAFAAAAVLVVGLGRGLASVFGLVDDESISLHFSLGNLALESVPQLSEKFRGLSHDAGVMNRVLDDNASSTLATKTMHEDFNKILEQSPGYAAKFIAGVQGAGMSTEWYSKKLQEHVVAAEDARVAQERFALQMEIVDARARGDSAAVYGLTLQLNALPSDKDIYVATHGIDDAIYQVGVLQEQLGYLTSRDWAVAVNIQGDTSLAAALSDRNVKRDIVSISWN